MTPLSPEMRMVEAQIQAVAPTDADVLVVGESGVGKERVAQAIHDHSGRAAGPLVKVNCASIPRELFESEFFGHVRGAFTGAERDRPGRFALADGGTLFLDEVAEIPLELQGKLLRVLQEREFERVGDHRTQRVDVRVVAATNRDLDQGRKTGRFRPDLYYRLNVFPIRVPPLRTRGDDIVRLAQYFLDHSPYPEARQLRLGPEDERVLRNHSWPGNVRELENVMARAVILALRGDGRLRLCANLEAFVPRLPDAPEPVEEERIYTCAELKALERSNIERALVRCGGRLGGPGGAAELLQMHRTTLASRIKALGIERVCP